MRRICVTSVPPSPCSRRAGGWRRSRRPAASPAMPPGASPSNGSIRRRAPSFPSPSTGAAYARRGTTFGTRLTVIDRDSTNAQGAPIDVRASVPTAAGLLAAITANVPQRQAVVPIAAALVPAGDLFGHAATRPAPRKRTAATAPNTKPAAPQVRDWGPAAELAYETPPADEQGTASGPEATHTGVYEPWRPRTARIPGACEHPTPLVQSAAMAAAPTRLTGGNWYPTLGDHAKPACR